MTVRSGELRSTSGPALRRRGWLAGLVPVVVALSVAACTTTGPTGAGPSTSTGASVPSASPTTPPSPTATATTTSDDAPALAAVRAYFAEFNSALASRSTVALRQTHTDTCIPCVAQSDKLDAVVSAGRTLSGGQIQITDPSILERVGPTMVSVGVDLRQAEATIRDRAGKVVETYPAVGPIRAYLLVRIDQGKWKVSGVST